MSRFKSMTLSQLKSEMQTLVAAAKSNTLSPAQAAEFDPLKAALEQKNAEVSEGERIVKGLAEADDSADDEHHGFDWEQPNRGVKKSVTLSRDSFAKGVNAAASKSSQMAKAAGSTTILPGAAIDVPILSTGVQELGRHTLGIVETLKTDVIRGRNYDYMRQTTRENNAAVVAPGATKPTSNYGVELVSGQTKVIAHLSDPVDEFLLTDVEGLRHTILNEMLFGLYDTLDHQVINGSGEGELTGILNTSGVQVAPYAGDALTTIRGAFTSLRRVGRTPEAVIVNPEDWQDLELLRAEGTGEFLLGPTGPIDAAQRKLWGVQVVESFAVPQGTAIVMQRDAAKIVMSEPGTTFVAHVDGTGLETNTLRFRSEFRADVAVEKPQAIVLASIADTDEG